MNTYGYFHLRQPSSLLTPVSSLLLFSKHLSCRVVE